MPDNDAAAPAAAPAPARAWRIVLEKIETDLLEGRLGPGDRLPPERELVHDPGRRPLQRARGAARTRGHGPHPHRHGLGPTSGAIIIATPRGGLAALLRLQVAAHGFPLDDVVATRLLLEEWVVRTLAATDGHDLDRGARRRRRRWMTATSPPGEFLALDAQFHLDLAEASGNVVVAASMGGLRAAIEGYVRAGAEKVADWDAVAVTLRHEHHRHPRGHRRRRR